MTNAVDASSRLTIGLDDIGGDREAVGRAWDRAALVIVAALALAYAVLFFYLAWMRYRGYLMHAEDLGNYEQAAWNTAHGHPFAFNNQRIKSGIEATGTTTRLSVHVEPILLLIALPYFIYSSPLNLLALQALVVASGAFPALFLARRYLRHPVAQVAFPLAYLLAPPLQAATLYEFHAVTLSAALLLWAFLFADGGRYGLFAVFAALSAGTKEEIGVVVGLIGLWLWWRYRDRTVGLTTLILGVGWSAFCVLVVLRHYHHGASSPFCGRFNPFVINGHNTGADARQVSCRAVAELWLGYPKEVASIVVIPQKLGFLHRMFVTTGYLSLLSPLTLAISLPSFALILFSNDVHMYSGLGHYPAELVPVLIVAAIVGLAWLSRLGGRFRRPFATVITVAAALYMVGMSVANAGVNGFTGLSSNFRAPVLTLHDQIGDRFLAMIPPGASVSAGDYLNPHLSDRRGIYLFPDVGDAEYAVVDVSRDDFPLRPIDEMNVIRRDMLGTGRWGIVAADDGYILMKRRAESSGLSPNLPRAFYTFVEPTSPPRIAHPLDVQFGPSLHLIGYNIQRREQVNLRQPDVLLTTYWRLSAPVGEVTPAFYLTDGNGAIDTVASDHAATDWRPPATWPVGRTMVVQSVPQTIFTNEDGNIDIDLAVYAPGAKDFLKDIGHTYRPIVRSTPDASPLEVVAKGTILKLAQVAARW